jgi:hypothetical protein
MRNYLGVSLLAASVVLAGCSNSGGSVTATGSSPTSGTILHFNPKLNSPYVYLTDVKITGLMAMDIKMTGSTVFSSKSPGNVQAVTTITDVNVPSGPAAAMLSSMKGTSTTQNVNGQGEVSSTTGTGPMASLETSGGVGAGVQGVVFPTDAIHEGQTWTTKLDPSKMSPSASAALGGNQNLVANNKVTKISGNTVTIDTTMTMTTQTKGGGVSIDSDTTSDFDRTDGTLIKAVSKVNSKMSGSATVASQVEKTITKQ